MKKLLDPIETIVIATIANFIIAVALAGLWLCFDDAIGARQISFWPLVALVMFVLIAMDLLACQIRRARRC